MSNEVKAVAKLTLTANEFGRFTRSSLPHSEMPLGDYIHAQQFLELVERAVPGEFVPEIPIRNIRIHAAAFNSCRTQFLTTLTALVGEMEKGK